MQRLILSVSLLVALVSWAGTTQALRWANYTPADGLPSLDVRDIVQAPDGSMWTASPQGLARLDGRPGSRWSPLLDGPAEVLLVDRDGVVWSGGSNGRIQWYTVDGTKLATPAPLQNLGGGEHVLALAQTPDGVVWIGTAESLWSWDGISTPPALQLVDTGRSRTLAVDAAGRLWRGRDSGVVVCEGDCQSGYSLFTRPVTALLATADGLLIAGASDGVATIVRLVDDSIEDVTFPDSSGEGQNAPIDSIVEDSLGQIWIARKQVYRFDRSAASADPTQWVARVFGAEEGLSADEVRSIVEASPKTAGKIVVSHTRELWFATDQGVSVQRGLPWIAFATSDEGLGGSTCANTFAAGDCNTVQRIVFDATRDACWFASKNAGLSRLIDGSQWTGWLNELWGGPLFGADVRAMHVDSDGTAWIGSMNSSGSDGGVQHYVADHPSGNPWQEIGRSEDRWLVSGIDRDADGSLWLATRDGAWRLDTTSDPQVETRHDPSTGLPYLALDALAMGERTVFVASTDGLARFDLDTATWTELPFEAAGLTLPVIVYDLLVHGGRVFATTQDAAGRRALLIADETASSLSTSTLLGATEGLDGGIFGLAPSIDQGVWIATQTGLRRTVPPNWRLGRVSVLDGLPEDDLVSVGVWDDEVWVGTRGDGAAAHRFEPPDTAILQGMAPVLTQAGSPVVIAVAAADPDSRPEAVHFEFRIDGGDWQTDSGSTIDFVPASLGLADGAHTLQVRAIDEALLVDRSPATREFELDTTPPLPAIQFPIALQAIRGTIEVRATTLDVRFAEHRIAVWRDGQSESDGVELTPLGPDPVDAAAIATWDTSSYVDDWYTLQVTIEDANGSIGVDRVRVLVDNEAPFADVTSPVTITGDIGGSVYSTAGEARLSLPPHAFDGVLSISISRVDVASAVGAVGYRLEPASLTLVARATLELRVNAGIDGVAVYREDAGDWIRVGGTPASTDGQAVMLCAIDRFGLYALRSDTALPAPGSRIIFGLQTEPRYFQPRSGPTLGQFAISFDLGRATPVTAMIYNRAGRARRVLAEGTMLGPGRHVLAWDGRDANGEIVAAGLYIVCVEAGDERVTRIFSVGSR